MALAKKEISLWFLILRMRKQTAYIFYILYILYVVHFVHSVHSEHSHPVWLTLSLTMDGESFKKYLYLLSL